MLSRCTFLALAATVVPLVAAHGHMSMAFVDDVPVPGPQPSSGAGPGDFAIRQISIVDPVKGASNQDLFCGQGSHPATRTVDAKQGSVLKFAWVSGDGGAWPHDTGPIITYMARCGSGGCANFDDHNAQFFKISELGRKDDGSWIMADLHANIDATTSATVPSFLPDGEYIVRHELIALHLAGPGQNGAEFYPACMQVRLSGGSTGQGGPSLPSGDQVVTFPGGYHDNDPGILVNVFETPGYTFPGPPLVNGASNGSSSGPSPNSSSNSAAPTSTGCVNRKKKKRQNRHHFARSRIMRRA